jgi:hypothetical protein
LFDEKPCLNETHPAAGRPHMEEEVSGFRIALTSKLLS